MMTSRIAYVPLSLILLLLVMPLALAGEAPSPESAEDLLQLIAPTEVDEEALTAWYGRLVMEPALVPASCRVVDAGTFPSDEVLRYFELLLAGTLRQKIADVERLHGIHRAAGERALEFAYNRSLQESVSVPEEAIEAAFEADRESFRRSGVAHFNFFFVPFPDGEAPGEDAEPPAELAEIARLADKGTEIESLRIEALRHGVAYSERPARGVEGSLTPLIEQALFGAEPGSWTGIVQTENGWHLFEVQSVRPGEEPSLERAAPRIEARLQREKTEALRARIREAMRQEEEGRALAAEAEGEELDGLLERAFAERLFADRMDDVARIGRVIANNAVIELWVNQLPEQVTFSEEELRAEFERNPGRYRAPEETSVLEAQVPLPRAEDFDSPRDHQTARVEMRRRLLLWTDELREEGRSFADLEAGEAGFPLRVIDRGTRPQGPRGAVLDRAVANLEEGAFSPPVVGREFYHIFELTERHPPRETTFEEARDRVERMMRAETINRLYEEAACAALEQ